MSGKKLVKNLIGYLAPLVDEPVFSWDSNAKRPLPCLIVGAESEEQSAPGLAGHYTVSGFVTVAVQGYEDEDNAAADELAETVAAALSDREGMAAACNAPATGDDERPAPGFHLNRLFVRGMDRQDEDSSTFIFVRFEAFTVARDSV